VQAVFWCGPTICDSENGAWYDDGFQIAEDEQPERVKVVSDGLEPPEDSAREVHVWNFSIEILNITEEAKVSPGIRW
jgi:hypothetical protein